jgi:nucleoside phosphorylase
MIQNEPPNQAMKLVAAAPPQLIAKSLAGCTDSEIPVALKLSEHETMQADVLLITATKIESEAALQAFAGLSPAAPTHIDGRVFFDLGTIQGARVLLTRCEIGASGLGASQQAIASSISSVRPAAVIMVGIAFGMNESKHALGSILVSEQLRPYDLQRLGTDSNGAPKIIYRGDKPHASTMLINLFKSAETTWTGPEVHFGTVLTGSSLVDNIDYRDQLNELEPEALGGEMEGAGLYVACHDQHVDWILVKAVCDYADGNKALDKKNRQATAAASAASLVRHTLNLVKIDWRKGGTAPSQEPTSKDTEEEVFTCKFGEETVLCRTKLRSLTFDVVEVVAHTHYVGIAAQYAWLEHAYPRSERLSQAITSFDLPGPGGTMREVRFDAHTIKLSSGRTKQVLFDIGSFFLRNSSSLINPLEYLHEKLKKAYEE